MDDAEPWRSVRDTAATFLGSAMALAACALLGACAAPPPAQGLRSDFRARAETQETPEARVSAVALGAAEAKAVFGVDLVDLDVQPVWLSVTNRAARPLLLFPIGIDPEYYPPYEVARRASTFATQSTRRLYDRLADAQMRALIEPGATVEGFVYARADEGVKVFTVDLHDHAGRQTFEFISSVPGIRRDFLEVAPQALEAPAPDLDDAALRRWLTEAPATTLSGDGEAGDPLNIALVGSLEAVRGALVAQGWDAAAPIDSGALRRVLGSFLFGGGYRYAPVSDLYVFGRKQDLAFQKARPTIVERNHLRLWLAPVRSGGAPVWLGQISQDVGVKLTGRLWPPTTHVIGPDVDAARFFLVQDLWLGDRVSRLGYVEGAPVADPADPARNAEGDPFFSDGRRAVFFVDEAQRGDAPVAFLPWTPFETQTRIGAVRLLAWPETEDGMATGKARAPDGL